MTFEKWAEEKSLLQRRNNRWLCDHEGCLQFAVAYIAWPSDKTGHRIYECSIHLPRARDIYDVGKGAIETTIDRFTRPPHG